MQLGSKENKCILELLGNFGVAKAIYFPRGKYSCQPFSFLKNTFLLLPYFPAYWKKTYLVFCQWLSKFPFPKFYIFPPDILNCFPKCRIIVGVKRTWILLCTLLQLGELSRSVFDPELFSHSAYDKFFVTFATKVPYLTFSDKIRQILILEMDREGGNKERSTLYISSFPISTIVSFCRKMLNMAPLSLMSQKNLHEKIILGRIRCEKASQVVTARVHLSKIISATVPSRGCPKKYWLG